MKYLASLLTSDSLDCPSFRLRSHRHEYEHEYESRFSFMARRSFTCTSGTFTVTCTST